MPDGIPPACTARSSAPRATTRFTTIRTRRNAARFECVTCHSDERVAVDRSIHGAALGADACESCHGAPHDIAKLSDGAGHEARCASCHDGEVRDYKASIHASALGHGDHAGATCRSCHGPSHGVVATSDPASPVSRLKIADTCGSCHANPDFLATAQDPVCASGRGLQAERPRTRSGCGKREGGLVQRLSWQPCRLPGRDAASRINHWRVPETCGTCHPKIHDAYAGSVHGKAVANGVPGAPVCTDCHGEHDILARASQAAWSTPLESPRSRAAAATATNGLQRATTCRSINCRPTKTASMAWR